MARKFKLPVPFLIVLGILVLAALMFWNSYNGLVRLDEKVSESWAQVENVYQRRLDLIPNLVKTVKGYAAHEEETFKSVIEARSKISEIKVQPQAPGDAQSLAKFQQAQDVLSGALSRLLVVVERYPDLKANQSFLALQSQLEGTENRITVERRRFNETARDFNTRVRFFPNNIVGSLMGFQKKAYFAADEGAKVAPKVVF
ncbi:MAG: LemA family protein [Omnitrophica bacterium GWA2_52_8]|nr:MAG: LemA family protein [Omnitrophica bacterium GWA2_52_8]